MSDETNVEDAKLNTDVSETNKTAIFDVDKPAETKVETDAKAKEEASATAKEEADAKVKEEADAAAAKEAESKKPGEEKGTVPETYNLTLPKDSLLDESVIDEISAYAKEKGLSNEDAQELVNRDNDLITQYKANELEDLKELHTQWAEEVKADPELGGDKFEETAEVAKRVIDRFGDDNLKEILNATGFGNHPTVVRFFSKMGKAMADDKFETPGAKGGAAGKKSATEIMYGGTTPA